MLFGDVFRVLCFGTYLEYLTSYLAWAVPLLTHPNLTHLPSTPRTLQDLAAYHTSLLVTVSDLFAAAGRTLALFVDKKMGTSGSYIPATLSELVAALPAGATLGSNKDRRAASLATSRNFDLAAVGTCGVWGVK